ncbi:MAG: hypothetical protein JXA44_02300 [Methanospirillaceae archaeon]|nr:hypothetical protein [Methanospirillaceae archaeon]
MFAVATATAIIILFEGGLSIRLQGVRESLPEATFFIIVQIRQVATYFPVGLLPGYTLIIYGKSYLLSGRRK